MGLIDLVITIWLFLLLAFSIYLDTRRPMSRKFRYKYRVKDDSIFRKIIKFKDKEDYPCNYFKVVPLYIFLLLAIVSSIILIADISLGGIISQIVSDDLLIIIELGIIFTSVAYFLFICILWEIVDYKASKSNEDEKMKQKIIRSMRNYSKKS